MPEYPFDVLPPVEFLPAIDPVPRTIARTPTPVLVILAAIAGWQAYGGDDLDPGYTRWLDAWMRKVTWYRLHRRQEKHYPWLDWKTASGPHK